MKNLSPVLSHIPANFAWGIDFDGHDLADRAALDKDDCRTNPPVTTATLLAPLNISGDKRVSVSYV
jgi:hypothetical protein